MRKVIAGINVTLDGYCDHTLVIADDELHQHYNELLMGADTMLFGRVTYQLMESYWPSVVSNPTGNKPTDDFGVLIDNIQKIVYSRTMQDVNWHNAELKKEIIKEEIQELKQRTGKNILAGSRSMIVALMQLGLVDEYQFCVHPVVAGGRLALFENVKDRVDLRLIKTKTFASGAVVLCYEPVRVWRENED